MKVNDTSCRWPKSVIYITTWKWMTRHADDLSPSFTSQPESECLVMQMTEVRHLHHNLKVNDTSCTWPKSAIYITTWKWITRHADERSPSFTSQPESKWHVIQMTEVRHLHHNLKVIDTSCEWPKSAIHHNLKVKDTSCRWPNSIIYITTCK
jgi:hypothetical protein